jgi:hypothetical protein
VARAVVCDVNPDPDPWVRIRQKIHQNRKMQMIPDPDMVRIRESYQTKGECLRIRILESGFGTFLGVPVSSLGTLEHDRVGLTRYIGIGVVENIQLNIS